MKRREFMTLIGSAVVGGAAAAWPAGAQQPGLDDQLRKSIGGRDVAGVVAMATDRQRVLYQGAFGMADVATGRAR